MILKLIF